MVISAPLVHWPRFVQGRVWGEGVGGGSVQPGWFRLAGAGSTPWAWPSPGQRDARVVGLPLLCSEVLDTLEARVSRVRLEVSRRG